MSDQEIKDYYDVCAERDRLKAELTALKGTTQFCTQCESYAKELDRLKAEVEMLSCPICGSDVNGTNWKAKAALGEVECKGPEPDDPNGSCCEAHK